MRKFIGNILLPTLFATGACAAAGLYSWAAVAPSAQIFGPTIRRTKDAATMALSFDDGPNPAITPALLDLLERYEIRATFFQIGKYVRLFPSLTKEVIKAGHTVGNHTETHPGLTFLSLQRIKEELDRCSDALATITGQTPRWMRPPYGYRGPQLNHAVRSRPEQLRVVMWSTSVRDWKVQPPRRTIQRLRQARGGDIVLLHDGDHRVNQGDRRHTVAALEYWLPRWKDAGIQFASLDDLEDTGAI